MHRKAIGMILTSIMMAVSIATISNSINIALAACTSDQINKALKGCSIGQPNTNPSIRLPSSQSPTPIPSLPSSAVAAQNNVSRLTQPAKVNPAPMANMTAALPTPPRPVMIGPSTINASPVTSDIQGNVNDTSPDLSNNASVFLGTPGR